MRRLSDLLPDALRDLTALNRAASERDAPEARLWAPQRPPVALPASTNALLLAVLHRSADAR